MRNGLIATLGTFLIWWVWLAAVVAWRRTRWAELIRWLACTSIVVAIWLLTLSIPILGADSHNLFSLWILLAISVLFVLMMVGNDWMHVAGFASLADWLRFQPPNPALRYSKAPPTIDLPPEDGRLWVPAAPPVKMKLTFTRRLLRGYVVFLVSMIMLMVLTVIYDTVMR